MHVVCARRPRPRRRCESRERETRGHTPFKIQERRTLTPCKAVRGRGVAMTVSSGMRDERCALRAVWLESGSSVVCREHNHRLTGTQLRVRCAAYRCRNGCWQLRPAPTLRAAMAAEPAPLLSDHSERTGSSTTGCWGSLGRRHAQKNRGGSGGSPDGRAAGRAMRYAAARRRRAAHR